MKTVFGKSLTSLLLTLALLLWFSVSFSAEVLPKNDCEAPTNLVKTGQTTSAISFSWNGTGQHVVKYVRQSDGYTSPDIFVSGTSYTFSDLTAGSYTFYFATDCDGEVSDFIVTEDVING